MVGEILRPAEGGTQNDGMRSRKGVPRAVRLLPGQARGPAPYNRAWKALLPGMSGIPRQAGLRMTNEVSGVSYAVPSFRETI